MSTRRLALSAAAASAVVVLGACAPQPTALEKYCDVVRQAEATYDPLSKPGSLVDPVVVRKALTGFMPPPTPLV